MTQCRFRYIACASIFSLLFALASCSIEKRIAKSADSVVLNQKAFESAHVGISIFEPATQKFWYDYQGARYFVPASNTKIPTCYVAMKYLGDSLPAISFFENDTALFVYGTGDPTLLHPDYKYQPVIDFLKEGKKKVYVTDLNWDDQPLGSGWSWNDYNEGYMAERSPLPVYGNILRWKQQKDDEDAPPAIYSIPETPWEVNFNIDDTSGNFNVQRALATNSFVITEGKEKEKTANVPFVTNGVASSVELLSASGLDHITSLPTGQVMRLKNSIAARPAILYSQPTDSMLAPMMHRSDNFFAEQSLLMVSNARLGVMNDARIIDTILQTDFKDLPQKPRWADGSGLSRYNLFSPRDFVAILEKMKNEFGMERLKTVFPTGGKGTISTYYREEAGYIFAKTGTLSGVVALSGFLYTKKDKLLIFSILVNNHQASATEIRRSVEKFLRSVRASY